MIEWSPSRRTVVQALLGASAAPYVMHSKAFASSCGDHTVRLGGVIAPDTLNPFATYSSFWPLVFTYDFLVFDDALKYPDRKGFAKEWSVADDDITWTFKIWPGMKWSDGQPATARDAAFTYNYLLGSIGTPHELNAGMNTTSRLQQLVDSITAVDDETLLIVTKVPTRWPVENSVLMVPEHIWKDISYADAVGAFRNDPPLVGTGPMIVSEFQQGQFARMTPNQYFRTGKPTTAGAIFRFLNSADSVAQGLKSADLDYGMNLTTAQWADLSKDSTIRVGEVPTEQQDYMAFNTLSGKGAGSTNALQDHAFRDAIGYAIDQKTIVDRAYRGHASIGIGPIVQTVVDYYSDLADIRRQFDLAEAGRRLDAAGYRDTNGDGIREDKEGNSFQLELVSGTFSGNLVTPLASVQLIANWLQEIGIPVSVTQLDPGALSARTAAPADGGGGWDLLISNNWPVATPYGLLRLASSMRIGSDNTSYWTNDKFDELLSEVQGTFDLKKSQELVDQAARLLYTDAPYIMLCHPFMLDAHRKDCFQGWGSLRSGYFPLDRLEPI
ncbi:ABC transporter substrate-binding protein [Mesorhizobium sp.]|uniref:ABC transporter substrate-binding protein n=1 Tax=Mesorhizobium sp. TaxID=1871066 RepID=UPI000FD27940|nr:ABC transporter substrate-binding protein [Mesorhizobium sp.]RVD74297.1 ABC transporter substrate-binding protein [Mesorhizobium sp. M4A.F.Ca.ET.029.04.2.1]RWF28756.1 MAG: ABC transporter substrate-binding protein [Mesorhizobium sp.]RWL02817.1 MAG: ABC transporter substrate-binding protein [Mesorhizobium sp.]